MGDHRHAAADDSAPAGQEAAPRAVLPPAPTDPAMVQETVRVAVTDPLGWLRSLFYVKNIRAAREMLDELTHLAAAQQAFLQADRALAPEHLEKQFAIDDLRLDTALAAERERAQLAALADLRVAAEAARLRAEIARHAAEEKRHAAPAAAPAPLDERLGVERAEAALRRQHATEHKLDELRGAFTRGQAVSALFTQLRAELLAGRPEAALSAEERAQLANLEDAAALLMRLGD